MKRRLLLGAGTGLLASPGLLLAQAAYPNKPIRYIVPVAPGGGSDMVGRTVTERWGKLLNQTFLVDNQAGGGGVIACQVTAKAPADGYTLLQGYVATHGTSPATRKLPYDPIKDFTPIGMIGGTPNVLVVNSSLPVNTLKEFADYLRKNPGKLSYGSAGAGSLTHLTMELFKQQVNSFMVHIPYRGVAPAFTDLIGGQTQAMFPGLAAAMPHIRSGRVRPLDQAGAGPQDRPGRLSPTDRRVQASGTLRIQSAVWKKALPKLSRNSSGTPVSCIAWSMQASHWSRSVLPITNGMWRARSRG